MLDAATSTSTESQNQTKPWYDKECSDAKKDFIFMQARNVFRRSKTDHSESEMKRQSKMYKNIIRLKKQNHSRQLHSISIKFKEFEKLKSERLLEINY